MTEKIAQNLKVVVAENYTTSYRPLTERLSVFTRTHLWAPDSREIDVFGRCWSLAWANFKHNQVSMHRLGKKIYLNGPMAVFIPSYSIIDTEIAGGEICWNALISDMKIDEFAPREATAFPLKPDTQMPQSLDEIKKFLLKHQQADSPHFVVEKLEVSSGIAERFRQVLNQSFEMELSISDLSSSLGYNHAVLDRAFKKAYGISPINYRNKMRVLDSVHKLVIGESNVSDVGYNVGFSSTGNFTKQFKKIMKLPPSEFRLKL